jgi:hypothetical protein
MGSVQGRYRRNNGDKLAYYNALDPASPDTLLERSIPRLDAQDVTIALATTGKMTLAKVTLETGELVTNLSFISGTTAGATMTSWWMALYDPDGKLVGQTADQVAGAIAASTVFTLPLATAKRMGQSGVYRIGLCVAATTVPTVRGITLAPAVTVGTPAEGTISEETTATYTTTAPAVLPALTARLGTPYFLAS